MVNSTSLLTQEVAALLRAARARHNVTQGALAEVAGVSQSQMSKMLRGDRPITIDQLDVLCEVLHLSIADVIAEADGETDARSFTSPAVVAHLRGSAPAKAVQSGNDDSPFRLQQEAARHEDVD